MFMNGHKRANYLKKINYFHRQGDGCYFQPYNFGTEPQLIEFGNNVAIASGVRFVNHDIVSFVFNNLYKKNYPTKVNTISIGSNVFIGCNTIVLPGVHIGNNVIIGGGSVITHDIPDGVVAAGVPCKEIGSFEEYHMKYERETEKYTWQQNSKDKAQKMIEYFWGRG